MDEFLLRAFLGGLLIALISAPLGCLVVWQRMAWFGAALSHAALLGIAMGFLVGIHPMAAILLICLLVTALLLLMQRFRDLGNDTALGILAHGSLALGLIAVSLVPDLRVDLLAYLFGDILTMSWADILWILIGSGVILAVLGRIWNPLLSTVVHVDLAWVEGHRKDRLQLVLLILLSMAVAMSMQVIGLLLVVSLLIIPAATARGFARSPEHMAGLAFLAAVFAVVTGLLISMGLDTPTGPSIVAASAILFALVTLLRGVRGAGRQRLR